MQQRESLEHEPDPYRPRCSFNRLVILFAIFCSVLLPACSEKKQREIVIEIIEIYSGRSSFVGEILEFRLDNNGTIEGDCTRGGILRDKSELFRKTGELSSAEYVELMRLARLLTEQPDRFYGLDKPVSDAGPSTSIKLMNPSGSGEISEIILLGHTSEFSSIDQKRPQELSDFISLVFEVKQRICS